MTTIDGQRLPRIDSVKRAVRLTEAQQWAANCKFNLQCRIDDRLYQTGIYATISHEAFAADLRMVVDRYLNALEALDAEREGR